MNSDSSELESLITVMNKCGAPLTLPQRANQRWSLDFVSDTLTGNRRFRLLAVVDDFTRECLALVADTSLSGVRVGRELDAIIVRRGRPQCVVSDNGTELTSMATQEQENKRRADPTNPHANPASSWNCLHNFLHIHSKKAK